MAEEEWVKVATQDDSLVAELLVTLKHAKHPPPPPPPKPALSLEWSVRQRRSKAVVVQAKKQAPRASPTTPLSWSGATSLSGGAGSGSGVSIDGGPEEESGRLSPLKRLDMSRSKVTGTSEATTSKKPRKKKTLAELKEEEERLEKEGRQLKRDLAHFQHLFDKEKAKNEKFKRMKLDMAELQAFGNVGTSELESSGQLVPRMASLDHVSPLLPPALTSDGGSLPSTSASTSSEGNKEVPAGKFVLPDLNMPLEENSSCDVVSEVS